jgi:hypothetical protein
VRKWALLLGGLVIWALHFFAIYGVASIFPRQAAAHWLTILLTLPALIGDAALLWISAGRRLASPQGDLDAWMSDVAALGAALSFIAVLWQAAAALVI